MSNQCETASDEVTRPDVSNLKCDPCLQDAENVKAFGYCVDCGHNLCADCFKVHLKPLPLRHHRLLDQPNVPSQELATTPKDVCTEKCEIHRDEIVKYYCEGHRQLGCSVCITLDHRTCDVGYIPTLAAKINETWEYKRIEQALEALADRARKRQQTLIGKLETAKLHGDENTEQIRKVREEIKNLFERLDNEMKMLDRRVHADNSAKINKLGNIVEQQGKVLDQILKIQKEMSEKEKSGQYCRLFVDLKHIENTFGEYAKKLDDMEADGDIGYSFFQTNIRFLDTLCNYPAKCCLFVTEDSFIPISENPCKITDLAILPDDKLAAVFFNTNVLKIISTKQKTVLMSRKFSFCVKGLSKVDGDKVAVWYANTIEVFSLKDELKSTMKIQNVGLKWPFVCAQKLFIGFTISQPLTIRMLKMDNSIDRTFPVEKKEKLYLSPEYIAVNHENTLIYVSDCEKKFVVCLSFVGEMKSKYTPIDEWNPNGIAVAHVGTVFVSDSLGTIHILTPDLKELAIIDGKHFGIEKPNGLAYADLENKLYVGLDDSEHIVVLSF